MELTFPKLYRYARKREHCYVAIPYAQGQLADAKKIQIYQEGRLMPSQKKVTSYYADGSVRYLFVRFLADLPANRKAVLEVREGEPCGLHAPLQVLPKDNGYEIRGGVSFGVSNGAATLFDWLEDGNQYYTANRFVGPYLEDGDGNNYGIRLGEWRVMEEGPLVAVLRCKGECVGEKSVTFEVKLTAYAEKPWIEITYRIINSTEERLHVASLVFAVLAGEDKSYQSELAREQTTDGEDALLYHTTGIGELSVIEEAIGHDTVRTCVGSSNYKTNFTIGKDGSVVSRFVDDEYLLNEANEHMAEVFYGTFFADRTDERGGVCATIYQAQQNYPKAVKADESGIYVMLVPKGIGSIVMASGMSREQRFLLHFHAKEETLTELDNRSLIYQMPDKPFLAPEVFRDAGVMPDIFVDRDKIMDDVEISLIGKCDGHARCYGMLNWGDSPDPGYTAQGRGKGMPVWTNNEYDWPHACALLYARTGERRFLDYMLTGCSHWMDVDVCHYSNDPLLSGGQWQHTREHCVDGKVLCSHEWVEGLLDCYHFSGDERALETALGIGENVLRLLETPAFQKNGESSARETGWALRTMVALYVETHDNKWLAKCEWILGHFKEWAAEYGGWLSPYTDNTIIRAGFMIAVAVGSIMRYYRIFPREDLKEMMLTAVDDMIENCFLGNGLFYYKELPSLNRPGGNTLLLEALTIAYELTGDAKYLQYGIRTFKQSIASSVPAANGTKQVVGDAVIQKTSGTKNFAQSFIPLSVYYKALTENTREVML